MGVRRPIRLKTRSKYHAKATTIDGIRFDSKAEARRYQQLCILEKVGEISELERQPVFDLLVSDFVHRPVKVGVYRADFRYKANGRLVVEDVKGIRTTTYRLKKKMVEAQYGIQITEVA